MLPLLYITKRNVQSPFHSKIHYANALKARIWI
jgi:hypothetical protein